MSEESNRKDEEEEGGWKIFWKVFGVVGIVLGFVAACVIFYIIVRYLEQKDTGDTV